MQRSAQTFAMGKVMSQSSAFGQGKGSKATGAMLCQALTTDYLIKERKSIEPSRTIAGLRTDSRVYFNWKGYMIGHNPSGF